jgi:replicative DNA helicase
MTGSTDERVDRTPPNNIAAERIVLGAMMLSADAIADVIEILHTGDYYRPANGTVHAAITDLYTRGEPVDPVAVIAHLLSTGDISRVGGAEYLHQCVEQVPTVANASWYAREVAEHAGRRRLIAAGTKMVQLAADPGLDLTSAMDQAGAEFYDATTAHDTGDLTPLGALLGPAMQAIRDASEHRGELRGISTGFTDLDQLTGGLRPGQLVVIAGRPGMGKSVAAVDIARATALRDKKPAAFFSLEMSEDELVTRILSAEARVPLHVISSGHLRDGDWSRLEIASGHLAGAPLHIDPSPGLTMTEIRARARRLAQREGLALVIVDYLQLMTSSGRKNHQNREQEVAEISRGMKLLAKELRVPVVAVAQLNRGPEQRQDKRPMLSDLRESGALEQDADLVIFVHRDDYYDKESARAGEADLIVAKHRGGSTDTITVASQLHFARFVDMAIA